jgi:hypothetical protein
MKHTVSPAMAAELRAKIPAQAKATDAQIALTMQMMGGNYSWYLSKDELNGSEAILILLHSSRDGDPRFKARVEDIAGIFPTAMAPGMAMVMSDHVQLAIDDLEAAGAEKIVVVPVVATRYNTLMRQWDYIFGRTDEAPYGSVPRVSTDAELLFIDPPGDDPIIGEILIDHALEIGEDPANEVVIVIAHGPIFEDDNRKVTEELANLAKIIVEDGGYADAYGISVQDDALPDIRDANVAKLRGLVEDAIADGKRVLVVTNLMGTRTIQSQLRKDLKGLDYKFNAKGVSEHQKFTYDWLMGSVSDTLERNQ